MSESLLKRYRRRWKSSGRKIKLPKFLTFAFYAKFFKWLFSSVTSGFKKGRVRNLLLGLPAMLVFAGVVTLAVLARSNAEKTAESYWQRATSAILSEDAETARLMLNRVIQDDFTHVQEAKFELARQWENSGNTDRAEALFRTLAPRQKKGFPKAHERLVVLLAPRINEQTSAAELEEFRWHLDCAGTVRSPGLAMAWGRYSIVVRNFEEARRYLAMSVVQHPEVLIPLGNIEAGLGDVEVARATFRKAVDHFTEEVKESPKEYAPRADLAQSFVKLGEFQKAEQVLQEGLIVSPEYNGNWNWMLAGVYQNYHDILQREGRPISLLLSQLAKALTFDPNHAASLKRLMSYAEATVEGNVEIREILERVVSEAQEPALAHMAIGNLCWLEGDHDQARIHFDISMSQRTDVPIMLNNMAWMLAHDESDPDLERALGMVTSALEADPENARFLDTRGTILVKLERWRLALNDLEKALKGVPNKAAVHRNLATVYENLGMQGIADQHRSLAAEDTN
ncbi:MAG: hypothetical protein NXI04_18670 [Planctomycetaceae bacterium]|nr:hypothetical protein [Planctomycetaceae bacterium]